MLIVRITVGGIAYLSAVHAATQSWGLLHWLDTPQWLSILVTLLFLDFAIYAQHIIAHKWSLLWRLHQIHHTDLDFDATTAVRFHPLEIIISLAYKVLCIYLIGADAMAVITFEIILNGCATFNHSNVKIPETIDKKIRWLLITPDMHRIHHSNIQQETDSNYGFSVSCWDRLCGTYTSQPSQSHQQMALGLKTFTDAKQLGFLSLLAMPFKKLMKR
jgi:sterol desaturase/sphingolipid hydroxylase (fatty acid hydroxylase superfamily)